MRSSYLDVNLIVAINHLWKILISILVISMLMLIGCRQESKIKKSYSKILTNQKIKVHLQNNLLQVNKIQNVTLAYYDIYGNRIQYDFDMNKNNGHDFEIDTAIPIYLKDLSIKQTYYLLFPNEELNAFIDSLGFINFTTKTNNTTRSNELIFFNALNQANLPSNEILGQALHRFPGVASLLTHRKSETFLDFLMIENVSYEQSTQYSLMKYQDRISFLNTYAKTHQISSVFKQDLLDFFKFSDIKFRLNIAFKAMSNKKTIFQVNQIQDLIHQLAADSCLNIPEYQESIQKYVDYLINAQSEVSQLGIYQNLKGNFKGKTADFAAFTLVKTLIEKNKVIDQKLAVNFKKDNKTPLYVTFIKDYAKIKASVPASTILDQTGKITSLEKIISNNKGKIIYLDLWASWCIPCKQNMPYSKALEKKYKDVQFVYLSFDHQKSAWEASTKELMLASSYLLVDNFSSKFARSLKVNTIPRYILINQQGKIVDGNAPRPNDNKIVESIDALLSATINTIENK